MRKCETPQCKNKAIRNRKRCSKCHKRRWREGNPLAATYANLRSNAKRRGKPFCITLSEWKIFCDEYNYLELRGRGATDLTVDCKEEVVGYVLFNMRAITNSENVIKENDRRARLKAIQDGIWEAYYRHKGKTPPEPPKGPETAAIQAENPEITPF